MKSKSLMDQDKLVERAVEILMRDLGPIETTRFLALLPARKIESAKRYRAWQSKLEKNAVL